MHCRLCSGSRGMYLTPLNSSLEAFLCKLPDDLRLKVEDCLLEGQDLTLTRTIGQGFLYLCIRFCALLYYFVMVKIYDTV